MSIGFVSDRLNLFACALRACAIMVGLGLVMLNTDYCQTGQTDCDMAGMDMETKDAVCVLACGVPFQYSTQAASSFVGQVSALPIPPVLSFTGFLAEPDVPPPRSLA